MVHQTPPSLASHLTEHSHQIELNNGKQIIQCDQQTKSKYMFSIRNMQNPSAPNAKNVHLINISISIATYPFKLRSPLSLIICTLKHLETTYPFFV